MKKDNLIIICRLTIEFVFILYSALGEDDEKRLLREGNNAKIPLKSLINSSN